jgi:hypothetical protein
MQFIKAAANEAPKVTLKDAIIRGSFRILQNFSLLMDAERRARPASGINTTKDKYARVNPKVSPNPGRTRLWASSFLLTAI